MTTEPLLPKSRHDVRSVKSSHCKLLVACAAVTLSTFVLLTFSSRIAPSPERAVRWTVHDVGQSPAASEVPGAPLDVKESSSPAPVTFDVAGSPSPGTVTFDVAGSSSPDPINSAVTKVPQPVRLSRVEADSPSKSDPVTLDIAGSPSPGPVTFDVAGLSSPDPNTTAVTKVPQPVRISRMEAESPSKSDPVILDIAGSPSPDPITSAVTEVPQQAKVTRMEAESLSPDPITSLAVTETSQPTTSRRAVLRRPTRRPCPTGGAVTVQVAGRLGNMMWQYATTWATSRRTNLPGFVPHDLRRDLDKVFRDLSVPSDAEISHCRVNWDNSVNSPYKWSGPGQNILLPVYPFYEELALQWVDDLMKEFTFRDELVRASQETLRSLASPGNVTTYVSVHVRRTDYAHHLWVRGKAHLADENFFLRAMAYFKDKYGDGVVFVVASDEPRWCQMKLATGRDDVFVVGGPGLTTPEHDLAVMAACNHSILDYGTFGVWGAIMAKGETVIFNCSVALETSMIVVKLFDNWLIME